MAAATFDSVETVKVQKSGATAEENIPLDEECSICYESFGKLRKRKRVVINLECGHIYCRVCLRKHAEYCINEWKTPECPDPSCSSKIQNVHGLLAQKKVRLMEKTKHDILKGRRQCPMLNCGGDIALFHNQLRCLKCSSEICNACEKPIDQISHL